MFTGGHVGHEVAADDVVVIVIDNTCVEGTVDKVRLWLDGAMTYTKDARVNFTNILQTAFWPIPFCQKI